MWVNCIYNDNVINVITVSACMDGPIFSMFATALPLTLFMKKEAE